MLRLAFELCHSICTGMLTMEGRCKTLDASADGYVRAETCIMLLLESSLSAAEQAVAGPADLVYLKGTFVNQVCVWCTSSVNFDLLQQTASHTSICSAGWPLQQLDSTQWTISAECY
jgi:hypothetical protein